MTQGMIMTPNDDIHYLKINDKWTDHLTLSLAEIYLVQEVRSSIHVFDGRAKKNHDNNGSLTNFCPCNLLVCSWKKLLK